MAHEHAPSQTTTVRNHEGPRKFDHCPLSLPDRVYVIFRKLRASSLSFKAIIDGLDHYFGAHNVENRDIIKIRFLYISKRDDRFTMMLKSDDICPNGFNCTKDHSSCGRLHTVIGGHVCPHIDVETMCCQHRDCRLVHLPLLKIRDRILSVIMWIYARRCRENGNVNLTLPRSPI